MFGFEKKKEKKQHHMEFDLATDMEKDSGYRKKILDNAANKIQEIETLRQQGTDKEAYEPLGHILEGYKALKGLFEHPTSK